jgi:hypothetical protein
VTSDAIIDSQDTVLKEISASDTLKKHEKL